MRSLTGAQRNARALNPEVYMRSLTGAQRNARALGDLI
jgi:hypothetical protein